MVHVELKIGGNPMSQTPARNMPALRIADVPAAEHPATREHFAHHAGLIEQVRQLTDRASLDAVEIATQRHRIEYLEHELQVRTVERNSFQGGYLELRAQISIVASSAIAATKTVADVAVRALEAAKAELIRSGVSPGPITEMAATDDGAAAMGQRFGANGSDTAHDGRE